MDYLINLLAETVGGVTNFFSWMMAETILAFGKIVFWLVFGFTAMFAVGSLIFAKIQFWVGVAFMPVGLVFGLFDRFHLLMTMLNFSLGAMGSSIMLIIINNLAISGVDAIANNVAQQQGSVIQGAIGVMIVMICYSILMFLLMRNAVSWGAALMGSLTTFDMAPRGLSRAAGKSLADGSKSAAKGTAKGAKELGTLGKGVAERYSGAFRARKAAGGSLTQALTGFGQGGKIREAGRLGKEAASEHRAAAGHVARRMEQFRNIATGNTPGRVAARTAARKAREDAELWGQIVGNNPPKQ